MHQASKQACKITIQYFLCKLGMKPDTVISHYKLRLVHFWQVILFEINCAILWYELRRCVRARTRAMCGRTCACEIHSEKCVVCACVRLVFGCAMCDPTFAHFFEQSCHKIVLKTILEYPILLGNIFPALECPFLF